MACQAIEEYKKNAEIYHGEALCKKKSRELLAELSLPKGLLPLDKMEEVGYNREAGFVWLKQKKPKEHIFNKIGKKVSYAPEVTGFVENRRFKKLNGVKSKEFLIWISLSDIYIDDPSSGNITFKTPTGLSRDLPVSAFELEEEEEEEAAAAAAEN